MPESHHDGADKLPAREKHHPAQPAHKTGHPGHNRLRPSKPKPSVPTKSVKEPEYGRGKKPKPYVYKSAPHKPTGRY